MSLLERTIDEAEAEAGRVIAAQAERIRFLEERERHFALALGVADGGQYRADWDARLRTLVAEHKSQAERIRVLEEALRAEDEAITAERRCRRASENDRSVGYPADWLEQARIARTRADSLRHAALKEQP